MSNLIKVFLYCVIAVAILFVGLLLTNRLDFLTYRSGIDTQLSLQSMWEQEDFLTIAQLTEEQLLERPLHPNYLLYNGLSHYYIANSSAASEEQWRHIERSIQSLRKLLLLDQPPQLSTVYFILGKAYYQKGQLYYPQTIEYIEQAISLGLENDEAYQYLGAAYSQLGQYDQSISYLQRAIERSDPDSLPLRFALTDIYITSGDIASAEGLFAEIQTSAVSKRDRQQAELLGARILIARRQYARAQQKLEELQIAYPNVADIYFYLGELYAGRNEIDRARYNWRAALKIDPNHAEALRQLQN